MRFIVVFLLSGVLPGCNQNNSSMPETDTGMSGTWRHTQIHDFHNVETDEYLFTEYFESTLLMREDSGEIRYHECWEYGNDGHIGIKTEDYFYMDQGTRAFRLNNDGSYTTTVEGHVQNPGMIDSYFNRRFELEKITNEIAVDHGHFVLSGPMEIREFNHVCTMNTYTNVFEGRRLQLIIPYDDHTLELSVGLTSTPEAGAITFTRFGQEEVFFEFSIMSNASLFEEIVGSNILDIGSAEIHITESSDSILGGSYSFVAGNDDYSGEFSIDVSH